MPIRYASALIVALLTATTLNAQETLPVPQRFEETLARDGLEAALDELEETLAIDIRHLREIINQPDHLVALPGGRKFSAGVLNLRGEAIPVINLRAYYGMPPYPSMRNAKIMILKMDEQVFGVIVDDIREIIKAENVAIARISTLVASQTTNQMKGHVKEVFKQRGEESRTTMVLDAVKLMTGIETYQNGDSDAPVLDNQLNV